MKNRKIVRASLFMALAVLFAGLLSPRAAQAQNVSQTAMAASYSVTLKVLPPESFHGPKAEMVRDGGAEPNRLNGPAHPNHHLVAFIEANRKPLEHGKVEIRYRSASSKTGKWTTLPVVRMRVAGKGPGSTHFGNNVELPAGDYEVRVTVDGKGPATFHFSL